MTDPTGAAVPEASVTATDANTGIPAKTASDPAGNYIFVSLRPGVYNLNFEKTGFKATVLRGIQLLVDQKARVDAQLQVGEVTTSVEVSGAAPLVETSTASVGTVIGERQVVDLPLNLRRFGALAILVPGTTTDNGGFASQSFGSPFSETSYAANGARSASNNTLIDGGDARNLTFGGFSVSPPPDAVQEFKVQTNIYSAAFGVTAGSTINLVTKSGSNDFHGSVYEFLRNEKLDARNFFAGNRPKYERNQYGFTIGGPIRKNKTFFFANYEGFRETKGLTLGSIVPTAAQLGGDFSGVLTGTNVNLCSNSGAAAPANLSYDSGQLFDPASESVFNCPADPTKVGQVDANGNPVSGAIPYNIVIGDPIGGNMITTIDPVAAKALSYNPFPTPNSSGTNNFLNQTPRTRTDHLFSGRIDHSFGAKDNLFGRYLFGQSKIHDTTLAYTSLPGFGDTIYFRGQNMALAWTHTFGDHLLNEARFGFQRNYDIADCEHCPRPEGFMAGFGINNFQAPAANYEGFPLFLLSNFATIGDSNYRPVISPDMVEKYQDNLTWTHGRHTVVVGGDMQFWQVLREAASYAPHGQIYYNGQYSSLFSAVKGNSSVSDLADFLLGYPSFAARTIRYTNTNQVGGGFWNFYAQDDFKASPNLTINYGLRYEFRRPAVDKRDNYVTLQPTGAAFSGPGNAKLVTAANDQLNDSFCTDPFYSYLSTSDGRCLIATSSERAALGFTGRTRRTLIHTDKREFAPRLGITWRPRGSDKLVVRTGYGIFYDLPNFNNQHFVNNNPVFSPSQLFNTNSLQPPTASTANIFGGTAGIPRLDEQYISLFVSPEYKAPNFQQWSFGIQSQLRQDWALEVNYIGTKGTHLGTLHLFGNQPHPGPGSKQARRPYPDFNQMLFTSPDSNSSYNSLQTKLTKRFSNGFSLLTAYTWAKSIDDNEGDEGFGGGVGNGNPQDDNARWLDRGRAVNDARQRLVFSYIWELPVGKGKHFMNQGGVGNAILGGWQLSGVVQMQSGFPFTVRSPDYSNTGSNNPRPDRTCYGNGPKTINHWFDTTCFTVDGLVADQLAGNYRFGNSGRNILEGPGFNNWDMAMLKRFAIKERVNLEFRFEMYNMWNYAHFGFPGTRVTSSTIGKISGAGESRDIQFGLKLSF